MFTHSCMLRPSILSRAAISMSETIPFTPIGHVISPYKEKFAIPRQPGLVSAAKGFINLTEELNNPEAFRGIESFSHLWVIFVFHATQEQGWKPLVRPPRLGGNSKTGVFATRSTFRPNAIGMSVVKNHGLVKSGENWQLAISELDLLHGTPVLDIKPYIPYSDAITNVQADFAQQKPESLMDVHFTEAVTQDLTQFVQQFPDLKVLIEQVLAQDPRPAYKKDKIDTKNYGIRLYDFNIMWRLISASEIEVYQLQYQPDR